MLERIKDIKIPADDPFAHDFLDRKTIAENLTTLVSNTATPYVMSISAPWGQGKTTFIRMWQQLLENNGFPTVYFDAWSSDYANDPLLSFIGAIDAATADEEKPVREAMGKVKTAFKKVVKASPKIAINWALRGGLHYITDGDPNAKDEIEAASAIAAELVEQEMAQHQTVRQLLDDFGKRISELGEKLSEDGKPLVIFVDELDRCRPDYAIELLERIKHLFAVPNLLIVLSVDIEKLGQSASQIIGFSSEESHGYLRRFIDLDYRLPQPDLERLIEANLRIADLPEDYYHHELSSRLASIARHRNVSTRDCLQVIGRFLATARSFPNYIFGIKSLMPFVLMEAHAAPEQTLRRLTDKNAAKEFIQEIYLWKNEVSKNSDYNEYYSREWIAKSYGVLVWNLAGFYIGDSEKELVRQHGQDIRQGMDSQDFRKILIDSISYSKNIS